MAPFVALAVLAASCTSSATESGAGKFFGKFADSVVIRIAKRDRQTSPDKLKDVLEAEPT
jgi:hypothetical protein